MTLIRLKNQPIIFRSSFEVEYRAHAATTCEIQWLKYILKVQSTIEIASNQVMHERTKHIEIDCHIVR